MIDAGSTGRHGDLRDNPWNLQNPLQRRYFGSNCGKPNIYGIPVVAQRPSISEGPLRFGHPDCWKQWDGVHPVRGANLLARVASDLWFWVS